MEKNTELRELRRKYNIETAELCEEIGIATGLYLLHESGRRQYKEDRYEQFYYDVANALERIHKRKLAAVEQTPVEVKNNKLSWTNPTDLALLQQEIASQDEDEEELAFIPLTENIFKQALNLLMKGRTIIQIAVELGICEVELGRKIGTMDTKSTAC